MFSGKMKGGSAAFIMAAGKKAGNLGKNLGMSSSKRLGAVDQKNLNSELAIHKPPMVKDAKHPVKPAVGAGRPARARKKP